MDEFLSGVLRLGIPLIAISLAASWYYRSGILNLALDGQVTIGSICYLIGLQLGFRFLGVIFVFIIIFLVGYTIIVLKERIKINEMLIGLGLLYFCYGLSQLLSELFFNNPGYATIGDLNIGEEYILIFATIIIILFLFTEYKFAKIRISKILVESEDLSILEGFKAFKTRIIHNLFGTTLLTLAAISLTEHGGTFTNQISSQRGFLALAIITISKHSGLATLFWALGFSIFQKLIYSLPFPSELLESFPYILAIVIIMVSNWKNEK